MVKLSYRYTGVPLAGRYDYVEDLTKSKIWKCRRCWLCVPRLNTRNLCPSCGGGRRNKHHPVSGYVLTKRSPELPQLSLDDSKVFFQNEGVNIVLVRENDDQSEAVQEWKELFSLHHPQENGTLNNKKFDCFNARDSKYRICFRMLDKEGCVGQLWMTKNRYQGPLRIPSSYPNMPKDSRFRTRYIIHRIVILPRARGQGLGLHMLTVCAKFMTLVGSDVRWIAEANEFTPGVTSLGRRMKASDCWTCSRLTKQQEEKKVVAGPGSKNASLPTDPKLLPSNGCEGGLSPLDV